jgi:hypothetical protein
MINNYHILIVKFIGPSQLLDSRVKIISERFHQSITFEYDDNSGNTLEQAEGWLLKNGHNVIGHGEGKDHYYVVCGHVNGSFQALRITGANCKA